MKLFRFRYRPWNVYLHYVPALCKPRGVLVMEICEHLEGLLKNIYNCPKNGRVEDSRGFYFYTFDCD